MTITRELLPAVAGIEIVHEVAPPLSLVAPERPDWMGSGQPEEPIVVRHEVGDVGVEGMRELFDIPPWMTYYESADGLTAIRYHSVEIERPVLVLRTVRPGYEYVVHYEFAPNRPMERRGREMSVYSLALAERRRGVMAHGCAFRLPNGKGVLCLGVSGAGKSTLARMMLEQPGVAVFNDDRQALTREPDGLHVWSTPWPGSAGIANAGDAPLGAVVLIGRALSPRVLAVPNHLALSRLLMTLALPNWRDAAMADGLALVDQIMNDVRPIELAYPLGPETAPWIVERLTEITT